MMRISKRVIIWGYTVGLAAPRCGTERESDPCSFVAWAYLGLFGVAVGWCRDGWIYPHEATRERAIEMLVGAPDPQVQTPAFLDEWDRLEAQECPK